MLPTARPSRGHRGSRRGRSLVLSALLVVAATALFALLVVQLTAKTGADAVARSTFAANAAALAHTIDRDDAPLLLPDLLGGGKNVYLSHTSDDPKVGWHAFRATAPGADPRCTLVWDRAARLFRDPVCGSGSTFPEDGAGLEQFAVTVGGETKNKLEVDLRRPPEPSTSTTALTTPGSAP